MGCLIWGIRAFTSISKLFIIKRLGESFDGHGLCSLGVMEFRIRSLSAVGIVLSFCLLVGVQVVFAQAPVLEVRLGQERPRVNHPFEVTYETRWDGEADAFAIVPTEVEGVPWAEARTVRTTTRSEDGTFIVAQTVEFIAREAGEFEVPPFVVGYFDPALLAEEEAVEGEERGLPDQRFLRAAGFTVKVRPGAGRYVFYGTAAALVAGLSAMGWWVARRRGQLELAAGTVAASRPETVPASMNLARQQRLDGKFYEFYKELGRGASLLSASAEARRLCEKLEHEANEVGYRGVRPTDDDMDGALKDLERAYRRRAVEAE